MRLYRFIVGPKQAKLAYRPPATFAERLWPALEAFFDGHNIWPNACYVSLRFPGEFPSTIMPAVLRVSRLRSLMDLIRGFLCQPVQR